jgi:Domain of unknown function (DUF4383)
MAKVYAQVVGVVLLLVGIIGLFSATLLGAKTTAVHNLIHLVSGAIGAYTGFSGSGYRAFAQIFGSIYTLVGIIGFVAAGTLGNIGVPVNTVYNLIHLVIGVWGIWVGFGKEMATA